MPNTKTSDEPAASTLDGSELVRVVQGGAMRRATAQEIADLAAGGGGGLFSPILSAVPSAASTGFSTWVNQGGATVADSAMGIALNIASGNGGTNCVRGRTQAAPGTPYTKTALLLMEDNAQLTASMLLGWTDGTKFETLAVHNETGTGVTTLYRINWNTANTLTTAASLGGVDSSYKKLWMQIGDDGTNITMAVSKTGVLFRTVYTVAKASGFLGASGYGTLVFGINNASQPVGAVLASWN